MKLKNKFLGGNTNGDATLEAKKLWDALVLYDAGHFDHLGISRIELNRNTGLVGTGMWLNAERRC
jgi:hypothetical protein